MTYRITTLDAASWDRFADLVERNNGIFGGCWCIGFHTAHDPADRDHRGAKERLVRSGEAHAALCWTRTAMPRGGPSTGGRRS
ncbi:MAG TPA: hypothetical protein VK020_07840 [Microlunatus sp.]|nr:hypothetical protein [Microlunatus sp.]